MKIEKVQKEIEQYICEYCGKKSYNSLLIQSCENEHEQQNCMHDPGNIVHKLTIGPDEWATNGVLITGTCARCGKYIGKIKEFSRHEYDKVYRDFTEEVIQRLLKI